MLIRFTDRGLYVEAAGVYIDPWKPVAKALITHGHSDHARGGHSQYICVQSSVPILKHRLGNIIVSGKKYAETFSINGVEFSFHPAGHIIGSAQIRVAHKGEIWVVSGDYKVENDGISEEFEPVACQHFITESTFGLPVFKWKPQAQVFDDMMGWWQRNASDNRTSLISAYSLGKAQRILKGLSSDWPGPVYAHGAIYNIHEILREEGWDLPEILPIPIGSVIPDIHQALIIAPPGAIGSSWIKRLKDPVSAAASGWMGMRGTRRRSAVDRGFVLSDHADWDGLNQAIEATGATSVYVTHGYTDIFSKWLLDKGYDAHIVKTEYGSDQEEMLNAEADAVKTVHENSDSNLSTNLSESEKESMI
jgi:putative mRNA 3-end processing factor